MGTGTARWTRPWLACAVLVASAASAQETGTIRGRLVLPRGLVLSPAELSATEIALDARALDARPSPELAFELAEVEPGDHVLTVRVPEFEPCEARVRVDAGRATVLDCPLVLGIVLEGRIVDQHGERVLGVEVVVRSTSPARAPFVRSTVLPSGTFRLAGIPGGDVTLTAWRAGYSRGALALGALPASACREGLVLELAALGTVSGIVVAPDGQPAANARLFLEAERSEPRSAFLRAGPDGRFFFDGLGATTYHVAARASGTGYEPWIASARGVEPGAELVLALARTGSVEVVVRGLAAGDETRVVVYDAAGRPSGDGFEVDEWFPLVSYHATATGSRIGGLEPGRYGLVVSDDEFERYAWRVVDVRAGETTRVELALAGSTDLIVRSFVDGAETVASVTIEAASGQRLLVGYGTCIRDSDPGERESLPPGAYRIHAERDGRTGTAEVVLDGEAEHEVRIDLR